METPLIVRWVRRSFWCWYDHLWGVIVLNILWTLLNLPWLVVGYCIVVFGLPSGAGHPFIGIGILLIALEFCLFSPPSVGVIGVLHQYVEGKEASVKEIFAQTKRYFWKGVTIEGMLILLTGIIFFNISFYGRFTDRWSMLGAGLTGLMIWGLFELGVIAIFVFPVMVSQETDLIGTLKHSLFFTIRHPLWGGVFLLTGAGLLAMGIFSGIGPFLGATTTAFLVIYCGFRELVKAEIRKREPGRVWPEDEERRSFREVIKPWE